MHISWRTNSSGCFSWVSGFPDLFGKVFWSLLNSPILVFHRFFARNVNKTVWLVSWQYREIITVTTISSFWDKLHFFHKNYVFEKSPPLPLSKSSRILGKFAITFISQNKEISLLALNQRFTKIFPSNYFFKFLLQDDTHTASMKIV